MSLPLGSLGTMTVKELETAMNTISTSISTTEVVSSAGLSVSSNDDLTLTSSAGKVVVSSSSDPVTFADDVQVNGALYDSATDSLKVGSKTITVNARDDASDLNASGSGILVCGTDYASFVSSSGDSGSKTAISALWTKTGSTEQWTLNGGDLAFSKVLPSGEVCTFVFNVLDSGDMVLKRTIGSQVSQMLSYWEVLN